MAETPSLDEFDKAFPEVKPGTPLPWRLPMKVARRKVGGCRSIHGNRGDRQCSRYNEVAYTVGLADDEADHANAYYLVEGANAYPELRELARSLIQQNTTLTEERDHARRVAERERDYGHKKFCEQFGYDPAESSKMLFPRAQRRSPERDALLA